MEKKLVKCFYISILIIIFLFAFALVMIFAGIVNVWKQYNQGEGSIFSVIFFSLFLVATSILFIIVLMPFLRDLPAVRKGNFERMTGTIVQYKKRDHDSDISTHSWHPITRDEITEKEIELTIINRNENKNEVYNRAKNEYDVIPEFYGTYTFIYLKYTKLAIIGDKIEQNQKK
ncbi:MAG: hypothetical protein LBR37_03005 [Erysipelotrichaceae bacterium]|jgi:hypothetical protein|nr:hypothetical protein [Erysipelotrichaceae bacterium]